MVINDLYRFWLDLPGKGITQFMPFNSQLKWIDKKRSGYHFYQRTLETSLDFRDVPKDSIYDFTNLMDLERQGLTCERVNITIDKYCNCDDTWTEAFYTGYIRLNAGEWDVSGCNVKMPVVVQDKATCLTTTWENDVNMYDYGDPFVQTSPFIGVVEKVTCGPNIFTKTWKPIPSIDVVKSYVTTFFWSHTQYDCLQDVTPGFTNNPWTLIKHTHVTRWEIIPPAYPFDKSKLKATIHIKSEWAREFVSGATMPDGPFWVAVTGGWARPINVVAVTPVSDETTGDGVIAIQDEWGTEIFFMFGILSKWNIIGEDANGNSTFQNGKELGPVIRDLLAPCGMTVVSNFLNINPDATAPANDYYTRAVEDFSDIVLYQISDLARIDETQSATIATIKLKDILDSLKVAGNLDIDIDGTVLRIEHLSYWPDNVGIDLTLSEFLYLIKDKWKYTYDQAAQPKNEFITWGGETDGKSGDFDGYPIEYDNNCVNDLENKNDLTISAPHTLTNILKIIGNEDYYDDTETIVMISTKNLVIQSALQPISGLTKLNGNLALGYLMPRYYDYGRPFKHGFINKILLPFYQSLRLKLQAPITIPFDCDNYMNKFKPGDLVKTQMGSGQIETDTYTDPDQTMEFKLRQK